MKNNVKTSRIIKTELIHFINSLNLRKKYFRAVKQTCHASIMKSILKNDDLVLLSEFFNKTISWHDTEEGFYYWRDISLQWKYNLINKDLISQSSVRLFEEY